MPSSGQARRDGTDWPGYGGIDENHYSPLKDINDHNVGRLGLAWYQDIEGGGSSDFVIWWAEQAAKGYKTTSMNTTPGIGGAAFWLGRRLNSLQLWRALDGLVALMMWGTAAALVASLF